MIKIDDLFNLSEETKDGSLESVVDLDFVPMESKETVKAIILNSKIVDVDFTYLKELQKGSNANLIDSCMFLLETDVNKYALITIDNSSDFIFKFAPDWKDAYHALSFAIISDEVVKQIEEMKDEIK